MTSEISIIEFNYLETSPSAALGYNRVTIGSKHQRQHVLAKNRLHNTLPARNFAMNSTQWHRRPKPASEGVGKGSEVRLMPEEPVVILPGKSRPTTSGDHATPK